MYRRLAIATNIIFLSMKKNNRGKTREVSSGGEETCR
jgi:hypothetical protein